MYFFDHAGLARGIRGYMGTMAQEFDDEEVAISARENFWEKLGELVPETAILNFRGCFVGTKVKYLAQYTGRTVTAVNGYLGYRDNYPNPGGPDYTFEGDLLQAYTFLGTTYVDVKWAKNVGTRIVWEPVIATGLPTGPISLPVRVPISNPKPNPYLCLCFFKER